MQRIDDLERDIVLALGQRMQFHKVDAAEVARQRRGVVALAQRVCDQLRSEHHARTHHD